MTLIFIIYYIQFNTRVQFNPREASNAPPSYNEFSPRPKILKLNTIIAIFYTALKTLDFTHIASLLGNCDVSIPQFSRFIVTRNSISLCNFIFHQQISLFAMCSCHYEGMCKTQIENYLIAKWSILLHLRVLTDLFYHIPQMPQCWKCVHRNFPQYRVHWHFELLNSRASIRHRKSSRVLDETIVLPGVRFVNRKISLHNRSIRMNVSHTRGFRGTHFLTSERYPHFQAIGRIAKLASLPSMPKFLKRREYSVRKFY